MNIYNSNYEDLKEYYDSVLNKDKGTFKSSNDEPTPIGCIEEILECVPMAFWERTDTQILDPCSGNGNWHLVAWHMMARHQPNGTPVSIRRQFVMNDINEARLNNVRSVFGEGSVTTDDFLMAQQQYTQKFDMIFANPPYAMLMADGSRASKNHNLTRAFLKASLQQLKPDGYLAFLIPDNWMSLADRNDATKILTPYKFLHLNIHCAKKWFPKVGSSFTWFVLQKTPHDGASFTVEHPCFPRTLVKSQVRDYMPLIYSEVIRSILNKTVDSSGVHECFKVETSSDLHKYTKRDIISATPSPEHTYRLIHTPKQTVYSKRTHKFQMGWKVFISTTDTYRTFVDDCGMTQSIAFIRCTSQEEADAVSKYLNHPMYVFINNLCRWGNFNCIRVLQRFPRPVDFSNSPYDEFGLTKEEQLAIEEVFDALRWKRHT